MKKYQSYKPSGIEWIGDIPNSWTRKKIKHLGNIISGGTPSTENSDFWNGEIPWIQSGKVQFRKIGIDDVDKFITKQGLENSSTKMVKSNSVLVALTGATCGNIGYLTFNSTINQSIIGIEPTSDYSSWFIYYFLTSQKNQILINQSGGAQSGVNKDDIKNISITIPLIKEQLQIVQFLDEKTELIDKLISTKEHKIELLKQQRTSLINEVITKGLNPKVKMKDSGIKWFGEIPEHWMFGKLNYLCDKIGDGLHSTPVYSEGTHYYFINGNNIKDGKIVLTENTRQVDYNEYSKYYIELSRERTLLLSINGTIGNLGYFNDEKVILGKSICYINLKSDNINTDFIYYFIQSKSIQDYFTFELTGTTIFNLSLNSIRKTPVLIPPIQEQQKIVEFLKIRSKEIDDLISMEQNKIDLLKEYRQSLISDVITGKIDVRTNLN